VSQARGQVKGLSEGLIGARELRRFADVAAAHVSPKARASPSKDESWPSSSRTTKETLAVALYQEGDIAAFPRGRLTGVPTSRLGRAADTP
jgi:hypothetical protein